MHRTLQRLQYNQEQQIALLEIIFYGLVGLIALVIILLFTVFAVLLKDCMGNTSNDAKQKHEKNREKSRQSNKIPPTIPTFRTANELYMSRGALPNPAYDYPNLYEEDQNLYDRLNFNRCRRN